jgi:pimeloyl-ACP methyl ester carboxylesterase
VGPNGSGERGAGDAFAPDRFAPWVGEYADEGNRRILLSMYADSDLGSPYAFYAEDNEGVRLEPDGPATFVSDRGESLLLKAEGNGQQVMVRRNGPGPDFVLTRNRAMREEPVRFGPGLAGTLLFPHMPGPHTCGIVVHGAAGGQRDFYRLFARVLVVSGVAALVYDKPGFGESAGTGSATMATQAKAIEAAVDQLTGRDDIAAVGIWGISNGMWAAPMVAARRRGIAFLAGAGAPGVSMAESEVHRRAGALRAAGVPLELIDRVATAWRQVFGLFSSRPADDDLAALDRDLKEIAGDSRLRHVPLPDYARIDPRLSPLPPPSVGDILPFIPSEPDPEMTHDPVDDYAHIDCPILLQYGAQDPNVPAAVSAARIAEAAACARNRDVDIRTYAEAGHLLEVVPPVDSTTGLTSSGYVPEEAPLQMRPLHFSRTALKDLRDWMAERSAANRS